jgi:hypothetical protein
MKLFNRKERRVKRVIIEPTEKQVAHVIKDDASTTSSEDSSVAYAVKGSDASTSSEESSIFAPASPIVSGKPHLANFVPASFQDVGKTHSGMDVHGCLASTCTLCASSNCISFIPRESSDIELLQKTMWAICGAEQEVCIPNNMGGNQKDKHFRCPCGREACGGFYEI